MRRVIHWFRRDLRITDNTALWHACNESDEIIPVYILSTWKKRHSWTGPNRQEFLCGCLESLSRNLEAIGGRLILRAGDPVQELEKLIHETHADRIYFNRGTDPYSIEVQQQLEQVSEKLNIQTFSYKDTTIFDPNEVLTREGHPFRVFTPYARTWHQQEKPSILPKIRTLQTLPPLFSLPVPTLDYWGLTSESKIIESGEKAARKRLTDFLNGAIGAYREKRNFPGERVTSRLSQDLRFGTLSPRQVYFGCVEASKETSGTIRRSIDSYVNELVWREFYMQILAHFPGVLDDDFSDQFFALQWDENDSALKRWCDGVTGFPIVDAGMRELNATGFMPNRVRMIVAMFLTKDLHLHWRKGERYFMQKLVDGDMALNNGGWQWSAGTGADAAPYFRIQNPWSQTKRYDPAGLYIKTWVPELREVDPIRFTQSPTARLAKDYPMPIVDHAAERLKTLERFNRARRGAVSVSVRARRAAAM
ncbi:MAG: deoxyribodipyrimidine photo-lyase [Verrucomicrobia bacterium]|nr:deoxyribodipyrimidine photo-lyase [Verrucomicrobiota bacterium]